MLVLLLWFPVFLGLLKSLSGIVIAGLLAFFHPVARLVFEIRDRVIRFMVLGTGDYDPPFFDPLSGDHAVEIGFIPSIS